MIDYQKTYGKEYYENYGYTNESYIRTPAIRQTLEDLADALCNSFMFYTHMDIGCAFGYLVQQMRYNGVRSNGCDISEYAINGGVDGNFVWDISQKRLFGEYDIVTCVEVVEHIPPEFEEQALDNICYAAGKYLYFSSDDNPNEPTHVNIKPRYKWVALLEQRGFEPIRFDFPYIPWGLMMRRRD